MIAVLLGFIKNKLQAEMKMGLIDIVGVFRTAVAGSAEIADDVSGLDNTPFLQA